MLPAWDQVERVDVTSYAYAAELDDKAPRNTLAAKFSVPFAVATRLVHGSSAMASFDWDAVRNPAVLALAQKVSVSEDPAMTLRLPLERPARVVITLKSGGTLSAETGVNRGDDASPYTREELHGKFMDLAQRVWPKEHALRLLDATLALGGAGGNMAQWVALLRKVPA